MTYEETKSKLRRMVDEGGFPVHDDYIFSKEERDEMMAKLMPNGVVKIDYSLNLPDLSGIENRLMLREDLETQGIPYEEVFDEKAISREDFEETLKGYVGDLVGLGKRLGVFEINPDNVLSFFSEDKDE